jgi:hypothetical protein
MIYDVAVITNGIEHPLSSGAYLWQGEDGWAMPPVRRLTERGGQQHGSTDRGFLLEPRPLGAVFRFFAETPTDLWAYRSQLITWFAPYNSPALKVTLAGGLIRHIDCYYAGDMTMPASDRDFLAQAVGLQLIAPDPSWYDPAGAAATFALGGGGDAFTIPHAVPHGVGASTIDQVNVIAYTGTWFSFPHLIRITGPIEDAVITNEATGEKLDFTGVTIAGGDYYDIDTRYGRKTVVDSSGVNKIADLTSDSDLATFHLAPDSAEAPGGLNSIRVTGTSVTEATGVAVNYYIRDLGI